MVSEESGEYTCGKVQVARARDGPGGMMEFDVEAEEH